MTEFGAVHDGERASDSPTMSSAPRVCRKCGAQIFADAPEGLCTACLFETGLDLLTNASVAADDDSGCPENIKVTDSAHSRTNRQGSAHCSLRARPQHPSSRHQTGEYSARCKRRTAPDRLWVGATGRDRKHGHAHAGSIRHTQLHGAGTSCGKQ